MGRDAAVERRLRRRLAAADRSLPVAIDEAVSIAGKYCGAEAPRFVNGILSAASGGNKSGNGNGDGNGEIAEAEAEDELEQPDEPAPEAAAAPDPEDGEAA